MSIESLTEAAPVEFPCDVEGCDKVFYSRMSLQGHQTSHRLPEPCPECGKEYRSSGALGNHRKHFHNVVSENSKRQPVKRSRRRSPEIDLDWTVDDILSTVITALWPGDSIPVRAVLPLIQWRETTREFLEKVQSE